jgi:hypothetical protein
VGRGLARSKKTLKTKINTRRSLEMNVLVYLVPSIVDPASMKSVRSHIVVTIGSFHHNNINSGRQFSIKMRYVPPVASTINQSA